MADEALLQILLQGPVKWNAWRRFHEVKKPDLSGADLNRVELPDASLEFALLTGARLNGANLTRANLYGSDLSGAKLCGAHLYGASLAGADLTRADLTEARLNGASLFLARLQSARLNGSELTHADLSSADLTDAYLTSTNLTGATISGTRFHNSMVSNTVFGDVDLRGAEGLETVRHGGPSVIGIGTIYRSEGKIPEVFLRGCGVPEDFITYMPSFTANALDFYSCFISYSHADKSFARRLHDALQGRGIRCWLDDHQLLPGDKIYTEVDRGIRLWDKVLLCCSKESLQSWWVDNEIETAFEKEQQLRKDRGKEVLALIPLNLDGHLFSPECSNSKAAQVRSRLAADFTGWEADNRKFEEQFKRLVKALRTDGGREPAPPSKL